MPPSCPHAVFTPEDSLVVGGHFYTSAHLPLTLEGLRLQEQYPEISNEDLSDGHYEALTRIFDSFNDVGTSDEVKQTWANCCLFHPLGRDQPQGKRTAFVKSLKKFESRAKQKFDQEPE